jgi:hypothetical protein
MNSEGQPLNISFYQIPSIPMTSPASIIFITLVIYIDDKRREGRKVIFKEKNKNFHSVIVF